MSGPEAFADGLVALRERKRVFDDVWLVTLFIILLGIAVPWFLRLLDVPLGPVLWSLFGFGTVYLVLARWGDSFEDPAAILVIIGLVQAAGVLFIGLVWHLAGGAQNPVFLLAFAVPVVAGGMVLPHWQAYATAILSVLTVFTVALMNAPELRWYLYQAGLPAEWLLSRLPDLSAGAPQPFPGLTTLPGYLIVLLISFTVLLLSLAVMTDSFKTLVLRVYGQLASADDALTALESLSTEMLRSSPTPTALLYADTLGVAQASESFMRRLLLKPGDLPDKNLFGLIEFSYPEIIQELIAGSGGEVPTAVYRVGGELRVARVLVHPIRQGRIRYACIRLDEITDFYYLKAAFDAVEEAVVLIGAERRILYCNRAALDLLPQVAIGVDAAPALRQPNLPESWWDLGLQRRFERQFELHGRAYRVYGTALRVPGEPDSLNVLRLCQASKSR